MVIEFPGQLYTQVERQEDHLINLLEANAEVFYERTGFELTENQLEVLAMCISGILADSFECS